MIKRLLLFSVLALFHNSASWAYTFSAKNDEGVTIYYKILNEKDLTCEVTYQYSNPTLNQDAYTGDIVIPETTTYLGDFYSVVAIGEYAFKYCYGLTSVIIGNSVTSIEEYAFYCCRGLTLVDIGNNVTKIGECAFQECTALREVTIPNNVASIGSRTFSGCTGLTHITISGSVTAIGSRTFQSCIGLTQIEVAADNEYYCSVDGVLYSKDMTTLVQCPLSSPLLPSFNIPDGVTTIGDWAFASCSGLKQLIIGESVTTIGNYAFYGCSSLTQVTIGNSVTSIGSSAFEYCSGLTSVTIPNSVTTIGNYAFCGCTGLTEVTISNNVTEISDYSFYNCTSLKEITIPKSVTTIGNYAFSYCTLLTEISIPESVTSIGDSAFYWCIGLSQVTIGNSLTAIGYMAFNECTVLDRITSLNPIPPTCSYTGAVFGNVDKNTCVLYVPEGSKEAYATAYQWSDFKNIVEFDMTPVRNVTAHGQSEVAGYYTTDGKKVPTLQRGINIIRYSDGTARKVLVNEL